MKLIATFSVLLLPLFIIAQSYSSDPATTPLITTDIDHFWDAFDRCQGNYDPAVFNKYYLKPGSPGIKGFRRGRIISPKHFARVVQRHKDYYASIRASTYRVSEMEDSIRLALQNMKDIYPEARFPPVYFVVGALNSGGTSRDNGLIIGVDMYGKQEDTPMHELNSWLRQVLSPVEKIPHIVAHELVHYQQDVKGNDLLSMCIKEGSADFIGELVSGRHINEHVHDFANPREKELWLEFKERMHRSDADGWLYTSAGDRPNDLGYWMGYKITKAYYDKSEDKLQAIDDILHISDAAEFLKKSGYMSAN